jgi:hypothetical protein
MKKSVSLDKSAVAAEWGETRRVLGRALRLLGVVAVVVAGLVADRPAQACATSCAGIQCGFGRKCCVIGTGKFACAGCVPVSDSCFSN